VDWFELPAHGGPGLRTLRYRWSDRRFALQQSGCIDIVTTLAIIILMATSQTTIQVRIDAKTKRESKRILDLIGLDMSSAVKILLRNIVVTKSFPIELRTVNGFTLEEERLMLADAEDARKNGKRYTDLDELFRDLDLKR
jgi:DNA-damage-inducible protein J